MPKQLEAHIEAHDEHGTIIDKQTAWAPLWRCDMLIDRAAVFLIEMVDPAVPRSAETSAPPSPSSKEEPSSTTPPPMLPAPPLSAHAIGEQDARERPARPPERRSPWIPKLAFFAGGGPTFWPMPEFAWSLMTRVEARWTWFSVGVQARYDLAWSLPTKQEVSGDFFGGAATICGHHRLGSSRGYLLGCALGGIGSLKIDVDELSIKDGEANVVDVGARLGIEYWSSGPWGVELHADALYLAGRPAIRIDQAEVWRPPAANIAVRIGMVGLFDVIGGSRSR